MVLNDVTNASPMRPQYRAPSGISPSKSLAFTNSYIKESLHQEEHEPSIINLSNHKSHHHLKHLDDLNVSSINAYAVHNDSHFITLN